MNINVSSFVDDLVPEHINSNYPELVEFIKVYALYLEHKNKSSFYLNQLDHQRDIDLIETRLLDELQNEIGTPIPRTFAADHRLFYKHLTEFYRSRGTPESIKGFFKLIYDDEVEIYFPKDDMLIPSDGKWHDYKEDVILHPENYTPSYTWTITEASYVIDKHDDRGFIVKLDDDVITVNGAYKAPDQEMYVMNGGGMHPHDHWMHKLTFEEELQPGDVVEVYRRGLFTTPDGMASNKKYIQDSYFYQKFSYVLRTGKNIDEWKSAFTRLIHPAGFIFFGEIIIFIEMMASKLRHFHPGYQASGVPFTINIMPVVLNMDPNELGTYIEKEYTYLKSLNTNLDLWDHFENTKFFNWRPILDFKQFTFEDVINNRIGTQIGCHVEIS